MAKFYGVIGYEQTIETSPGVWEESIVERNYYGDVERNTRRLQSSEYLHDDITISNEISIVADPFATDNFHSMRYVVYRDVKWKIVNIEERRPRLILTLGGIYNG